MASSGAAAAYLTTVPGRADGEALLDEAAEDVVDALAWQARWRATCAAVNESRRISVRYALAS